MCVFGMHILGQNGLDSACPMEDDDVASMPGFVGRRIKHDLRSVLAFRIHEIVRVHCVTPRHFRHGTNSRAVPRGHKVGLGSMNEKAQQQGSNDPLEEGHEILSVLRQVQLLGAWLVSDIAAALTVRQHHWEGRTEYIGVFG